MNPTDVSKQSEKKLGILYTIGSFGLWGILPIYWKALNDFSAGTILSHRIFWSFVFVLLIITYQKQWPMLKEVIKDRKRMTVVAAGSMLISANWFLYIWAVNNNHIVEAALGYYINPLVSVLLGMVFLKERLTRGPAIALSIAAAGVLFETVQYGQFPWVAVVLALSFGFYGLVKKTAGVNSNVGLALETLIVVPFALGYIIYSQIINGAILSVPTPSLLLFLFSGVVTALPLLLFAKGAQRIPLSTLGFIQYLAPSISLCLGIFLYGEAFTNVDIISFGLIWCAIGIFTWSQLSIFRPSKAVSSDLSH